MAVSTRANVIEMQVVKLWYSGFSSTMVSVYNTKSTTLQPIIHKQVKPDSIVYTNFYTSYDVLDVSEFHYFRINHSTHFAESHNYINGIGNFV